MALRAQLVKIAGNTATLNVLDGDLNVGDELVVVCNGQVSKVTSLRVVNDLVEASLDSAISANTGDIITRTAERAELSNQFQAQILWQSEQDMVPGRSYTLVCAGQAVSASITRLKYKVEKIKGNDIAARRVTKDETINANISRSKEIQ